MFLINIYFKKDNLMTKSIFFNKSDNKLYIKFFKCLTFFLKKQFPLFIYYMKNIIVLNKISFKKSEWKILKSFIYLLPLLFAHLKLIFKKNFTVDFSEISLSTINVLKKIIFIVIYL